MYLHLYGLLKLANACVHTPDVIQSSGFAVRQVAIKQNTIQTPG